MKFYNRCNTTTDSTKNVKDFDMNNSFRFHEIADIRSNLMLPLGAILLLRKHILSSFEPTHPQYKQYKA